MEVGCIPCSWSSVFVTFNIHASVTRNHIGAFSKTKGALCVARSVHGRCDRDGAGAPCHCQLAHRAARACRVFLLSGISGICISTPNGPRGPQLSGAAAVSRGMLPKGSWMSDLGGQAEFEGGAIFLSRNIMLFFFYSLEQKLASWQSSTLSEAFWCRTMSSRA